ncbi:MAG: dnaJ [Acidobacteria bacterium]|jgi:curved DNA-binding protein CbpA|nr:dnaJ [Acidobacteriota bacterium]
MVSFYEILKVSPKASNAEIKSAYRRLARKLHPDVNGGSEEKARDFAKVAKAYEVLGNPHERAQYDKQLLESQYHNLHDGNSVFSSENLHARKWRQMVYEKRYNDIIDRMIADERRESLALQKIIFPTVGLFASTLTVAIFKPSFFSNSAIIGKIIFIALFIVGVIHLFSRLRDGFEKYTRGGENLHDSILDDNEPAIKPYSRFAAVSFLVLGFCACLGVGLFIGNYLEVYFASKSPTIFSPGLKYEFIFYPPIVVLFVDAMHSFVASFD